MVYIQYPETIHLALPPFTLLQLLHSSVLPYRLKSVLLNTYLRIVFCYMWCIISSILLTYFNAAQPANVKLSIKSFPLQDFILDISLTCAQFPDISLTAEIYINILRQAVSLCVVHY